MQLFSPSFHRRIARIPILIILAASMCLGGVYYHCFRMPEYCPDQPVAFSHSIHAGKLGMDCSACHKGIYLSPRAGLPDTNLCLDCHRHVMRDSPRLEPVLRAADIQYPGYTGEPLRWARVNILPGFVQFNHQAHVSRGVGCSACHGDIAGMEQTSATQNRGMRWCIDCHQEPSAFLRPLEEVTAPGYHPETWLQQHPAIDSSGNRITDPATFGAYLKAKWMINPKTDCTACHQ